MAFGCAAGAVTPAGNVGSRGACRCGDRSRTAVTAVLRTKPPRNWSTRDKCLTGGDGSPSKPSGVDGVVGGAALDWAVDRPAVSGAKTPAEPYDPCATVRDLVSEDQLRVSEETAALHGQVDGVGALEAEARACACGENAADATRAVHGGERARNGTRDSTVLDGITTPLVRSSTFKFHNTAEAIMYNLGTYESFKYGRYGNPTTRAAEEKLMAIEGAEDALLAPSGMNSVSTLLIALVPENGHVITTTDCYRQTRQFLQSVMPKMGIRTTVIDPSDVSSLDRVLREEGADLFFSESPTNPHLRVVDVPAVTGLCKRYGVISVIDTTLATPLNHRALDDGADLVLHSGTKYLAGHNDVMCGALAGRADLVDKVRKLHHMMAGSIDPAASYLLLRGMKTLELRVRQQNRTAEQLASFLVGHPKISRVWYPTVPDHPDHEVAMRQNSKGWGGLLSFEIRGSEWSKPTFDAAGRFVDSLRIPYIATSFGGTESLVEQVCIMSYFKQTLQTRMDLGITNGLIRFACGVENTDDIIEDVDQALEYV